MKRLITTAALCALAGSLAFGNVASAEPRHYGHGDRYDHYDRHNDRHDRYDRYDRRYDHSDYRRDGWRDRSDWRRGGYVARNDWDRGYRVDYRRHHLRAPPRGYEWRRVNDNYVLAAVATGLIASIIINGGY